MTSFDDLIKQIEAEAEAEGPEAVAQFERLREFYSRKHEELVRERGAFMRHCRETFEHNSQNPSANEIFEQLAKPEEAQ